MTAWRKELERNVTQRLWHAYQDRQAPPEVIHRRVDGREVLNRRLLTHHNNQQRKGGK